MKFIIIGRSNVGKSTLFNKIINKNKAISYNIKYLTKDINTDFFKWNNKYHIISDTGGINFKNILINKIINKKIFDNIKTYDIILLILSYKEGLLDLDKDIYNKIKTLKKKIYIIINKVDNNYSSKLYDFYNIGTNKLYFISAINNTGISDLLDDILNIKNIKENKKKKKNKINIYIISKQNKGKYTLFNNLINKKNKKISNLLKNILKIKKKKKKKKKKKNKINISIIGRQNVGKSTLFNTLINKNNNIVLPDKGTTIDYIKKLYNKYNLNFTLYDTPGIKKKNNSKIEYIIYIKTLKIIKMTHICLFIIDINIGFLKEEYNILKILIKYNKFIIIIFNKIDLVKKYNLYKKILLLNNFFKKKIYSYKNIYINYISAKNKKNIFKILKNIKKSIKILNFKISKNKKNIIKNYINNLFYKKKKFYIKKIKQIYCYNNLTFIIKYNKNIINKKYKKYIINYIKNYIKIFYPIKFIFKKNDKNFLY